MLFLPTLTVCYFNAFAPHFTSFFVVASVLGETLIGGEWQAIVRYDTAHGRPHKDLLHPDGTQDKQEFYGYAREEVLTLGERDIKANWKRYRAAHEQEMGR